MGLTPGERSAIQKVRSVGSAELAVALSDGACAYLAARIARDLGLAEESTRDIADLPPFFETQPPDRLTLPGVDFWTMMDSLADAERDAVTYFCCLGALHKARLKYARILQTQPIPTMDQVGPRGLLQYGSMTPKALTGFLLWRKWLYDIDNRAAQETGYLFEPILAHAVGGVPVSAKRSPIRRDGTGKGRQVDIIREGTSPYGPARPGKRAYEIKLRVTIAASGQGRWREELTWPADCRASGYTPILIVFDPTPNPKLSELERAFRTSGGEVYVGPAAWRHLDEAAGPTLARFLETYVRQPIDALLQEAPATGLPDLSLALDAQRVRITVGGSSVTSDRGTPNAALADTDALPDDVDDALPGP